jgi:NTP pyrophosphatase (non-canonical NTP hydrolase)
MEIKKEIMMEEWVNKLRNTKLDFNRMTSEDALNLIARECGSEEASQYLSYFYGTYLKNSFYQIGERAYNGSVERGFGDSLDNDDKALLLVHSEISEAVEALRHNNPPSKHIPEFNGVEEELADIVIRVCNYAYAKKFRLDEAVIAKMDFNDTREYQHGGKTF